MAAAELGEQKVEIEERRASGKFDFDIPAKTLMKASSSFPMEYHRRFPLERIVTIRTIEFLFQIPVRLHITLH